MKYAIVFACALAAVACKSKSSEEKAKGSGTASASASGTGSASASASGSGSASASGSGSASASGSGSGSAPAVDDDQGFAALEVAMRKMCECKDIACLETTEAGLKELELPADVTPEFEARMRAVEDEVQTCALKIAEATPLPEKDAAAGTKLLGEFQALRDQICKCKDQGCAEAVATGGEELDAKVQAIYALDEEGHLPPAFEAVMKSAAVCFQKLLEPPQ